MSELIIKSPEGTQVAKNIELSNKICVTNISDFFYYRYSPAFVSFHGEEHNFYEFFCTTKGTMVVEIENEKFLLKENQFIIVPKNKFHKMYTNKCYASSMSINFDCTGLNDSLVTKCISTINEEQSFYLNSIARIYTNNYRNDGYFLNLETFNPLMNEFAHDQEIKNCIENLLIITTKNIMMKETDIESINNMNESKTLIAKEVREYLLEHYNETVNLKDIAVKLNYSVPHICRTFKNYYNSSINNYINIIRINKSVELIESSEYKLQDIATLVGFDSLSYFSKVFKKYTGLTPKSFLMTSRKTHLLNVSYIMSEFIK